MKYWEDVAKPSFKEVKRLRVWQQPFGYVLLAVVLPVFYIVYRVMTTLGFDF